MQTFTSIAAQDGWILESSENSNAGGSFNAGATVFRLGDNEANRQYRAILSFNTAPLPDGAIIQSAVLQIRENGGPIGSNPFSILGKLWVDISKGLFGTGALQPGDFNATASAVKVGAFNNTSALNWYTANLNTTGRNNINKVGPTQLRLYFDLDDNNDESADFIRFFSGNAPDSKPALVITYTIP